METAGLRETCVWQDSKQGRWKSVSRKYLPFELLENSKSPDNGFGLLMCDVTKQCSDTRLDPR